MAKGKPRGQETFRDMFWTTAVFIVGILAFVALLPKSHGTKVHPVDTEISVTAVRNSAPYPVLVPGPPEGWTATSVRNSVPDTPGGIASLRIGYYTAGKQFVSFDESNAAAADVIRGAADGLSPVGTHVVAGQTWQEYRDKDGHPALSRTDGAVTLVVSGTASLDELSQLVTSLRAA